MQHLKWPFKILSAARLEVENRNYHVTKGKKNLNNFSASFNQLKNTSFQQKSKQNIFKNVFSVNGTTLKFHFPKVFSNSRGDMQEKICQIHLFAFNKTRQLLPILYDCFQVCV
jgi:hypothetical protein